MTKTLRLVSLLLLVVVCVGVLASCGIDSYQKRLEDAGYTCKVVTSDEIKEKNEESEDYTVKASFYAYKGFNSVTVTQFANAEQAEKYADDKDIVDVFGEVEVKGNVVIMGTEDAVDVALGK